MVEFRRQLSRAELASLTSQRTPGRRILANLHAKSQLWSNKGSPLRISEMVGGLKGEGGVVSEKIN